MSVRWIIQRLIGYTDGRPSWAKVWLPVQHTYSLEAAKAKLDELSEDNPQVTYRIRKAHSK